MLLRLHHLLQLFGIDFYKMATSLAALPRFLREYKAFKAQYAASGDRSFTIGKLYPCLADYTAAGGVAQGQYFHQDLYVARRIFESAPRRHVDIGSRVDGFVAHVAVFREIEVLDIRPISSTAKNIKFVQHDVMQPLGASQRDVTDSLSSLHVLEHFGLGRYGDPLDLDGHKKGIDNMLALLEPGGRFYLSVPIGKSRIEFNGQRIFGVDYILATVGTRCRLDRFAYINDAGNLIEVPAINETDARTSFGCHFGCGIFEFVKSPT